MGRIQFDWDEANPNHIALQGITPEEAEHVLLHRPLESQQQARNGESRMLYLGVTETGRVLYVATIFRGTNVRVVTAWPAKRKWFKFWRDYGD